jgi:hypothetical protein
VLPNLIGVHLIADRVGEACRRHSVSKRRQGKAQRSPEPIKTSSIETPTTHRNSQIESSIEPLTNQNYSGKIHMSHAEFTDEITLAARAEKLGETALMMGLIPSFVVRHFQG